MGEEVQQMAASALTICAFHLPADIRPHSCVSKGMGSRV